MSANQKMTTPLIVIVLMILSATAYSEVPIDSPRGKYEGADNIHWYQQQSLKAEDYLDSIPRSGSEYVCNSSDDSLSCEGFVLEKPMTFYHAQGRVPINVAVWVDDRTSSGFDFPYRRAIREIRRMNDTMSRSGINAQLYITKLETKNLSQFSGNSSEIYDYYNNTASEAYPFARENSADAVVIVRNTQDLSLNGICGTATPGPQDFFLPILVLTCVYEGVESVAPYGPTTAAHELGHILGLAHESQGSIVPTILDKGYGYEDLLNETSTVMASGGTRLPVFSSPKLIWEGRRQSDTIEDSVTAANEATTTVALFYERKWGRLSGANGASGPRFERQKQFGPAGVN
jgi:hypothetical protein